jgi:uncharacterized membrane protein YheB (UPF0754 family)
MASIDLLKKIIAKRGVLGTSGRLYLSSEELATRYILECAVHLNHEVVRKQWGEELVAEINEFKTKYELNNFYIKTQKTGIANPR